MHSPLAKLSSTVFASRCLLPASRGTRLFGTAVKDIPAEITESRFELEALRALERIYEAVEQTASDAEASLNEGVLRIEFPDGVFVINKHALTKQLWYSSPVIGPAYFEAMTAAGRRWYSLKLEKDVYDQLVQDVKKLANIKIVYPSEEVSAEETTPSQ